MDKIENQINEISFNSEFENLNFPLINLTPIEQEKRLDLLNKFYYSEDLTKKDLLQLTPLKKVRFITYKKPNKTSFIVTKKIKRDEIKNKNTFANGRWTKEERTKFAYGLYKYGTNWKKIRQFIGTRNNIQLRSHAQKFLIKVKSSKALIEKGLNFSKLNWENSFKLLKKTLINKELLTFLISIESEIEDNKRITCRYIERKESMLKAKSTASAQNNSIVTTSDENTENIMNENEPEIFKLGNNNINLNENDYLYDMDYNKIENFLLYQKNDKENLLFGKYFQNMNKNLFNKNPFINNNNNNLDFYE